MVEVTRLRRLPVAAATLALVFVGAVVTPTSPAAAAAGLALEGRGFGHGIGMSQYGARYRAEAGQTYTQILAAYYPGTALATESDSDRIRVRIDADTDNVTSVQAESGLRLRTSLGTAALPTSVAGGTPTQWRIRLKSGSLAVEALVSGTWRNPGSTVSNLLNGRNYAEFVATDGAVRLILGSTYREYVGVVRGARPGEAPTTLKTVVLSTYANYLPSVVASEMPTSWASHALKAQAVAARTYAMFDLASKGGSTYYDTCDTTSCQVFHGRADYTASGSLVRTWSDSAATAAVSATAGRFLRYDGGPAFTQFSASNGGYSVAGSRPYLAAAADSFDRYPAWSTTITASSLQSAYTSIGAFTGISISRDGKGAYGGRATTVRITGSSGSVTVTGAQFRSQFGLRSTLFSATVTGTSASARDIDRDGRTDLITVTPAGRAELRLGAGGGSWGTPTMLGGAWRNKTQVTTVYNLTSSGTLEILAVEGTSNDLASYAVQTSGSLGPRRVVHTGNWGRYDLFMGVNGFAGSGSVGMLVRGRETNTLYYFPSNGSGGLGSPVTVAKGWSTIRLAAAVGDWTSDGHPDVMAIDTSSRLWLYPGTGNGGLGRRVLLSSAAGWGDRTSIAGGSDWNGNGTLDLISVTSNGALMLNGRTGASSIGPGRRIATGWVNQLLT